MRSNQETPDIIYKPLLFTICTFVVTWCCAGLMAKVDYEAHIVLYTFLDFMENASPLLCALILLSPYLVKENLFFQFFLGVPNRISRYVVVFSLFIAQFLNFYLFRVDGMDFSAQTFMITFAGQLVLGGGLEEGGWRGYLLPNLYRKHNILLSSVVVSLIWVFWHIPYFFISDSMQAGESFFSYSIIGIITGFILTAIYLLTKSVLLCMLFHSWQNTIVMTIQADMSNIWFMILFLLLGVISILLCMFEQKHDEL